MVQFKLFPNLKNGSVLRGQVTKAEPKLIIINFCFPAKADIQLQMLNWYYRPYAVIHNILIWRTAAYIEWLNTLFS